MPNLTLSISFCYHDSCITISDKTKILLHLEAERYFRQKNVMLENIKVLEELVKAGLAYIKANISDVEDVFVTKWNNKFQKNNIRILGKQFNVTLTSHHQNHIGTSFPSGFQKCIIVCADGGSEDGTTKIYLKKNKEVTLLDDLNDTPFTGKFYGTITQMVIHPDCKLAHNTYAGKLMGLSSIGVYSDKFFNLINAHWREINKLHFSGCNHLLELFNLSDNYNAPWNDKDRVDLAYTAHNYWVNNFSEYLKKYAKYSENVCLVGGCALNISLNSKLIDDKIFNKVYVSPISSDCGQSLGAILYNSPHISCEYPFLGRGYGEIENFDNENVTKDLLADKIIGWYQGRSEIGPRSLGHRSFIGLPISTHMKHKLSILVKRREEYRPVAAIVPEDMVSEYFEQDYKSPFMTFSARAKLITQRLAPAIVHYDETTRVQTLSNEQNPELYQVLLKLKELGKVPILMNSSFNIASEPIVDTPQDAIKTYLNSKSDCLYINGNKYKIN